MTEELPKQQLQHTGFEEDKSGCTSLCKRRKKKVYHERMIYDNKDNLLLNIQDTFSPSQHVKWKKKRIELMATPTQKCKYEWTMT